MVAPLRKTKTSTRHTSSRHGRYIPERLKDARGVVSHTWVVKRRTQ